MGHGSAAMHRAGGPRASGVNGSSPTASSALRQPHSGPRSIRGAPGGDRGPTRPDPAAVRILYPFFDANRSIVDNPSPRSVLARRMSGRPAWRAERRRGVEGGVAGGAGEPAGRAGTPWGARDIEGSNLQFRIFWIRNFRICTGFRTAILGDAPSFLEQIRRSAEIFGASRVEL